MFAETRQLDEHGSQREVGMEELASGKGPVDGSSMARPLSVEEAASDALRRDIVRLDLAPDTRLRLDALAERYSVSHTPMRQALRRLEAEGLVTSLAHRGSRVAPLSSADVEVIETVTGSVEAKLARLGAPLVSDAEVRRLHAILEKRNRAVTNDDLDSLYDAVWAGRDLVYAKADRPALLTLARQWRQRRERYLRFLKMVAPEATPIRLKFFDDFVSACEMRDGERAAAATLRSTEWTAEEFRRLFRSGLPRTLRTVV